jgi:hypothetical protein
LNFANGFGFANQSINPRIKNNTSIEILYQNVRGLRTKLDDFYESVLLSDSDLIAITETGCNHSIKDSELVPAGYTIIRCDRMDGRKQGGACLVATPRFELRRVIIPGDVILDNQVFELVSASVYLRGRFLFLCCVMYIPPKSSETDYLIMFRIIEQYCNSYSAILVLGDFNLYSASVSVNNYFEYFKTYCGFTQSNRVENCIGRCLDLVLSTWNDGSVSVSAATPLVRLDPEHPALSVRAQPALRSAPTAGRCAGHPSPHSCPAPSVVTPKRWNFFKADFPVLYSAILNIDWSPIVDLNLEQSLDYFYGKINSIIKDCVPEKKQNRESSKFQYPAWYTKNIIRDIKIKAMLHKKYKASGLDKDYRAFSGHRAKVKNMIKLAHKHYTHRIQNHLLKEPKAFWNYIKDKRGGRSPRSIVSNGTVLSADQCAGEFARYFQSVYSTEKAQLDVSASEAQAGGGNAAARVHLDHLNYDDVDDALRRLKPKTSSGPDGIPPFVFRDCRAVLIMPLLHIFNLCLGSAVFPERWKTTRVIPVPKGSMTNNVEGYRPVAVLSTPAKILESAIYKSLYGQVSAQLADEQHGFRAARSTTSNLLNYMADVFPVVDGGVQVDVAYFDFKKAFDLVDNDILLIKLAAVGFSPHLLQIFASYMTDRQQYVEYAGHVSDPYYTRSGVSQGSNLGPLEFLLIINDLPGVVREAKCLLFADDLKVYIPINGPEDCKRLQEDIDRVVAWSESNRLQFNTSKSVIISLSRARNVIKNNYKLGGVVMRRVSEVRDLGVQLTTDLSFSVHIKNVCIKAYRNLGFILRRSHGFTNISAIIALYNALVRSLLECNAAVWSPQEAKYKLMLERVQNKFTRYLYMKLYGVYPFYPLRYPGLFVLGMVGYNELRVRRDFVLICYIHKLLRGKVHNPEFLRHVQFSVPDRYVGRRRAPALLALPRARTQLLAAAPLTRAMRTINKIAERVDIFSCSLSEFARVAMYVICYSD